MPPQLCYGWGNQRYVRSKENPAMEIQALGYVGVGASNLQDWSDFATNWLGMQMVERRCRQSVPDG